VSATSGKQDRSRPRLEVLPGGRTEHDAGGADWQGFQQRIGWQQLTEPALADDYEDRLVARLFAPADHKLVSLQIERMRRRAAPSLSVAAEARLPVLGLDQRGANRWDLGWQLAAVAVVAMLVAGAALLVWRGGEAPPEASTVPTPVPEEVPPPVPPAPVDDDPQTLPELAPTVPDPTGPDPGVRRAERPLAPPLAPRRARRGRVVEAMASLPAVTQRDDDVSAPRRVGRYRISPESDGAVRALPAVSSPTQLWLPVEAGHRPTIRLAAQPASGRAPTWRHLAMADARSGSLAMALVDVLELDRRLSEAL